MVVDGSSFYFETLKEGEASRNNFAAKGASVDDEIYRDTCLPMGTYFVGDPSDALRDWEEGKGSKYPLENAVYKLDENTFFALYVAANGPGTYFDEEDNSFVTRSGYIAILPVGSNASGLNEFIDEEVCEELAADGKAAIAQFDCAVDTQIDRQCEGCIDFGGFPFIFTGDESWHDSEGNESELVQEFLAFFESRPEISGSQVNQQISSYWISTMQAKAEGGDPAYARVAELLASFYKMEIDHPALVRLITGEINQDEIIRICMDIESDHFSMV